MASASDYRRCPAGRKPDRTIVVMGKTGNGKSAVANVLAGKYSGGLFPESSSPASQTRGLPTHTVLVSYAGKDHAIKIVDTIGYGDTSLSEKDVLHALAKVAQTCTGGINQILFVTRGRFTQEDKTTMDAMMNIIFQPDVANFSTIVRTATPAKELDEAVVAAKTAEYRQEMIRLHPNLAQIGTFLMISNPDDGDERSMQMRRRSRKTLLDHVILHYMQCYATRSYTSAVARVNKHLDAQTAQQEKQKRQEAERKRLQAELKAREAEQARLRREQQRQVREMRRANAELQQKAAESQGDDDCIIL
ncbi:GTPase IMAP family member 4-like [Sycon ciliatum]|uniref:GTPase IMAP family member 4-like n=1 Tax=Sycon ciliatum TaxID=27933 RepID=UPI0031F6C639